MVQAAAPAWPPAGHHSQTQSMQSSLSGGAISGQYEQYQPQTQQCANGPGSPVGYMTCGNTQYALMAVPMPQCDSNPGYAGSSTYQPTAQDHCHQQQWGQYQAGPSYEVGPSYQCDQQWASPYECGMAAAAMAGGSARW